MTPNKIVQIFQVIPVNYFPYSAEFLKSLTAIRVLYFFISTTKCGCSASLSLDFGSFTASYGGFKYFELKNI